MDPKGCIYCLENAGNRIIFLKSGQCTFKTFFNLSARNLGFISKYYPFIFYDRPLMKSVTTRVQYKIHGARDEKNREIA